MTTFSFQWLCMSMKIFFYIRQKMTCFYTGVKATWYDVYLSLSYWQSVIFTMSFPLPGARVLFIFGTNTLFSLDYFTVSLHSPNGKNLQSGVLSLTPTNSFVCLFFTAKEQIPLRQQNTSRGPVTFTVKTFSELGNRGIHIYMFRWIGCQRVQRTLKKTSNSLRDF